MRADALCHLVYISRAIRLFPSTELAELLYRARERNQQNGVTGLLLYKDRSFIQLLEGSREAIHTIFTVIKNDSRHFRLKVLIDCEPIHDREFPDWSMGFQNMDQQHFVELQGYSPFLQRILQS